MCSSHTKPLNDNSDRNSIKTTNNDTVTGNSIKNII